MKDQGEMEMFRKEFKPGPHECGFNCHFAKDSMAIVASDGGRAKVLDYVGGHLDYWICECEPTGCFDGLEAGLWIWTGRILGSTDYFGEYDEELSGVFRKLTKEEWDLFCYGDELWDESEWDSCTEKELV